MTFLGLRLPVLLLFLVGFPLFWLAWIGVYAISPGPTAALEQIELVTGRPKLCARLWIVDSDSSSHDRQDNHKREMTCGLLAPAAGLPITAAGLLDWETLITRASL